MKKIKSLKPFLLCGSVLACTAVMWFYDTFISPPFYFKPIIKMLFFLVIPTILLMWTKTGTFKGMFRLSKKNFAMSLLGGLAVFVFILAAFFIFRNVFDFSKVAVTLEESIGVSRRNLLFVGIYISLVNSLLEEYFFRGVAFLTLKKKTNRVFAYCFSSLVFALYHVAVIRGWFDLPVYILLIFSLAVAGVIFNLFGEKTNSILPSWFVHMFANFAIIIIGFLIL